MTTHKRMLAILLVATVSLLVGVASRGNHDNTGTGEEEEEETFEEAQIFFEFNSTDNDLGVQVFLDGDAWKHLRILDPKGDRILDIRASKTLGELGLTELFFESDEPSPEEVLALFGEGEYEFEGRTVEGGEIEGESELSHELPPPPNILVPATAGAMIDRNNAVIQWAPIPGIARLEVIVENEDVGAEMTTPLSATTTSLHVPVEFLDPNTEYKVEILAIGHNGNKTISEREFVTGP